MGLRRERNMEIISEKIDGKIEAVLYDDDGKEMMVLPKVKNRRGKKYE